MKKILILVSILSLTAFAGIKTNVIHLEEGVSNVENTNVLVSYDGRVFEVDPRDTALVETLEIAEKNNLEVEIEIEKGVEFELLNKLEMITSAKLIGRTSRKSLSNNISVDPISGYEPTDLETLENATNIFDSLEKDYQNKSQCYNRAYIWSRRMEKRFGVKSMKIFIFYTQKYRNEVSGKWWFHVAPMVNVSGQYYAFDRRFSKAPETAREWEKHFTKGIKDKNYDCLKMNNIETFYDKSNTWSEFCNIQYTNMYFWGPRELKKAAKEGLMQTGWTNRKLKIASKEAFRNWENVYKEIEL